MKISSAFSVLLIAASVSGCLRTRGDVREGEQRQALNQQVTSLQRENADVTSRFSDLNEEIRELRGRVEVAESKINSGSTESDRGRQAMTEQTQDVARRAALLQESVTRMDVQMQAMNAEIQALRAEVAAARAGQMGQAAAGAAAPKGAWEAGVQHFDSKNWKKAILSFQEYREKNPKGKNIPEATYRMGVSFQELGLRDEARTFYDEVLTRFPKSEEARKAKTRLRTLSQRK